MQVREFALRAWRKWPTACCWSPLLSAGSQAVPVDVGGIDHLRLRRSSISGEFANRFPRYRAWQSHIQQAIAAPTTAFQHLHNAADHAPIVCLLDTSHIRMRLDPCHCSSRLPPKADHGFRKISSPLFGIPTVLPTFGKGKAFFFQRGPHRDIACLLVALWRFARSVGDW
jgi:hypothetical protein